MIKIILSILLGAFLWTSSASPAHTGFGSSPASSTASSSGLGDVVLVSDEPEYPQNDPGPTPDPEDLAVDPSAVTMVQLAGGDELTPTWDSDKMVWNEELQTNTLGEWYRVWVDVDDPNLLSFPLRRKYLRDGEFRLYPSEYWTNGN